MIGSDLGLGTTNSRYILEPTPTLCNLIAQLSRFWEVKIMLHDEIAVQTPRLDHLLLRKIMGRCSIGVMAMVIIYRYSIQRIAWGE